VPPSEDWPSEKAAHDQSTFAGRPDRGCAADWTIDPLSISTLLPQRPRSLGQSHEPRKTAAPIRQASDARGPTPAETSYKSFVKIKYIDTKEDFPLAYPKLLNLWIRLQCERSTVTLDCWSAELAKLRESAMDAYRQKN
jgi:hypothetical protein